MIKNLEKYFQYKDYENLDFNSYSTYINNSKIFDLNFVIFFKDKINWNHFFKYFRCNMKFIRFLSKYDFNKFYWFNLCEYQRLSESFIENNLDKLNWRSICRTQSLSEKFLLKHLNNIDWYLINRYQNIKKYKNETIKQLIESNKSVTFL